MINVFSSKLNYEPIRQQIDPEDTNKIARIVEQIESDEIFSAIKYTIKATVKSAKINIKPNTKDSKAQILAKELERIWRETIDEFFDCFAYGRVCFEKVWGEYDATTGIKSLRKLVPLPFVKTKMLLDEDNHYAGVEIQGDKKKYTLDSENSFWLALDSRPNKPYGRSRYLGAPFNVYQDRLILKQLQEVWNRAFSLGKEVVYAPSALDSNAKGSKSDLVDGKLIDPIQDTANKLNALLAGGSLILPSERDERGNRLYEFVNQAAVSPSNPLLDALESSKVAAIESMGLNAASFRGSLTSFGALKEGSRISEAVASDILLQIRDKFQKFVINPLVDAQDWELKPVLTISSVPYSSVDVNVFNSLMGLLNNGASTQNLLLLDIKSLCESSGIPVSDDFDEVLSSLKIQYGLIKEPTTLPTPEIALAKQPKKDIPVWERITQEFLEKTKETRQVIYSLISDQNFDPFELDKLFAELNGARAESLLAGMIWGYIDPIKPKNFSWQNVEDALAYLKKYKIDAPTDEFLSESAKLAKEMGTEIEDQIKAKLEESIAQGLTREQWEERIQEIVGYSDFEMEVLERTFTKRAYTQAQDMLLKEMPDAFPYVKYVATQDDRTRSEHSSWDGKIIKVGSDEYEQALELVQEYNCRCSLIPLNEEDAKQELGE
ncbi:MAG: phage head morphogenesis protein [Candidatus Obscuribacterales bacterium]|nr:phage head morphogenesis protein [Candidatus Obscuribacterales bacterium]